MHRLFLGRDVLRSLFLIGLSGAVLCAAPSAKALSVVTTTQNLSGLLKSITGETVQVRSLTRGYQDPHYIQAKPSLMVHVNRADMLFLVGLDLEVGWLPLLIRGARNPRLVQVDVSKYVKVIPSQTSQMSRAMGDVHPYGDPHYMLGPEEVLKISEAFLKLMVARLPQHQDAFTRNQEAFATALREELPALKTAFEPLRHVYLLTYHREFDYLMRFAGVEVDDTVEEKPGIPPSARHLHKITKRAKEGTAVLICKEADINRRVRGLSKKAKVQLCVLPTSVGAEEGLRTSIDLFREITRRLTALSLERSSQKE